MPLILPNDFVNGEIADAVPVQNNYDLIQGYINSEVITADGLTQMKAPLLLRAGDPTQPNHAAGKDYVDAQMPIGTMLMWPAALPPSGTKWRLCDGGALSTGTYATLFGLLAYRYGGSGGSFLLPNLKGRFPIGLDGSKAAFDTVGEAGGTFTVPVPPHGHSMPHTHPMPHTHEMPHIHNVDPASILTTGAGNHAHDLELGTNSTPGTTARPMAGSSAGSTTDLAPGLMTAVPSHQHSVNIPSTATGQPDDATTDASSAANTGASSAAETADNTAAQTGTGIATTMIQPYLTVNFIIRVI